MIASLVNMEKKNVVDIHRIRRRELNRIHREPLSAFCPSNAGLEWSLIHAVDPSRSKIGRGWVPARRIPHYGYSHYGYGLNYSQGYGFSRVCLPNTEMEEDLGSAEVR